MDYLTASTRYIPTKEVQNITQMLTMYLSISLQIFARIQ